jgi:ATP-binding cassette subfamily C protein CydC
VSTFGRLLQLTVPFHRLAAIAVALSVVTVLANVALMGTSAYLISKSALVTEVATLTIAVTSVRLFAILRASSRYGERLVSHDVAFRVLTHLRAWFYEAIEPLAPARLSRHRSGDLLSRSLADVETLEGFYLRVALPPAAAICVSAGACIALALFHWTLGLVLLAFLLAAGLLIPFMLWRLARGTAASLVKTRGELAALLVDRFEGVADLLVFDLQGAHAARFEVASDELARLQQRLAAVRGIASAMGAVLASGCMLCVLLVGVQLVASGDVGGVYLAVLALVAYASFEAVQPLSTTVQQLEASLAAGQRLFSLIDEPPDVIEPEVPVRSTRHHDIEFRDVSFRYRTDDRLVLDDASFRLLQGEKLAIAGESGAGKSTIVNLMLRFWEYEAGDILLGRRSLREYDSDYVRSKIGVMPQDVYLFNTTLRDNVALSRPDASDAEIEAACEAAQLHDMIAALPEGYDTVVGENGVRLSGGERQRLALARVILKHAPILILDEPTANLDAETEQCVLESLDAFAAGRTVLMISHRPAVWAHADRVITMQDGKVLAPELELTT